MAGHAPSRVIDHNHNLNQNLSSIFRPPACAGSTGAQNKQVIEEQVVDPVAKIDPRNGQRKSLSFAFSRSPAHMKDAAEEVNHVTSSITE